jgi:hypothetical protein
MEKNEGSNKSKNTMYKREDEISEFKYTGIENTSHFAKTQFKNENENNNQENADHTNVEMNHSEHKKICRICYCDDREVDSPLLNPCNCLGGVKYIHFSCLQHWLKSKSVLRSISNKNCITYTLKLIECEICKTILPGKKFIYKDFVRYNSKDYEVWDFIEHKFKNYIILETIISEKSNTKTMFIICFDNKKEIKIGRSHDSDIRITDISVSRYHAFLKLKADHIALEDNGSKFGSGVLLQHPKIPIYRDISFPLQIGRSVLIFNIQRRWSLCETLNPCKKKITQVIDYAEINSKFIPKEKLTNIKVQNDELDESNTSSYSDKTQDMQIRVIYNNDDVGNREQEIVDMNYIDNNNRVKDIRLLSFPDMNKLNTFNIDMNILNNLENRPMKRSSLPQKPPGLQFVRETVGGDKGSNIY